MKHEALNMNMDNINVFDETQQFWTKNKHSHSLVLCLRMFLCAALVCFIDCNRIQQEYVKTAAAAERQRAEQDSNKQIAESRLTRKHVYLVFTHSS